jgi:hypothetical protein
VWPFDLESRIKKKGGLNSDVQKGFFLFHFGKYREPAKS